MAKTELANLEEPDLEHEEAPQTSPGLERRRPRLGFTLIETIIALTVLSILSMILLPRGVCQIRKSKVASILEDLRIARAQIELFELEHGRWPGNLDEAFGNQDPPDTLYYCTDEADGNAGHGNETCLFFDAGNPSGNNNHGGIPGAGFMVRTDFGLAECANIDFAWSTCCGRAPDIIGYDDDFALPGHPGHGIGR